MRKNSSSSPSLWQAALKVTINLGRGLYRAWTESPVVPPRPPLHRKPKHPSRKKRSTAWWRVLGVSKAATPQEIKAAYRARMQESHPDKVAHLSPTLRKAADREAKKINDAYEQATRHQ